MTEIRGGCQCGQLRYIVRARPETVYCCHCRECQKQSASAFGMSLPVPMTDLSFTGRAASWERDTDIGGRTRCFFCPECGSRVWHQGSASLDWVTIKGGSLDDPSWLRPSAHIWVSRKQPWVVVDPDIPAHLTQPEDLDAWRHGGAA
ncbi:hypothetical protein BH10PSE13_BH10PSE13_06980 [soil metagenome]